LYKHEENWILFRTTQELFKREKTLYLWRLTGLTDEQKTRQLIERVEDLIKAESKCFAFHKPEQQRESGKLSTQATSSPTTSQGIDNSEKKLSQQTKIQEVLIS